MATHKKRFNFFIDEKDEQILEDLADEEGISKGELIRRLLHRESNRRIVPEDLQYVVGLDIYEFCKGKFNHEQA